jgi:hypothetical protein
MTSFASGLFTLIVTPLSPSYAKGLTPAAHSSPSHPAPWPGAMFEM